MKKPPESPDQKSELSRGSLIYWILTSSSHCRSNCINVPKFVCVPGGLDSLRYVEKATGFGGLYREIIMKKFRIFYQIKLGGLHLMVLL